MLHFFENVFPIKDIHSVAKFSCEIIPKTFIPVESF